MIRPLTIESICFEILIASMGAALAAWMWGMIRKSFGAIPAILWLLLSSVSLVCAAIIGILEFSRR